jgi:hypothetical protein
MDDMSAADADGQQDADTDDGDDLAGRVAELEAALADVRSGDADLDTGTDDGEADDDTETRDADADADAQDDTDTDAEDRGDNDGPAWRA